MFYFDELQEPRARKWHFGTSPASELQLCTVHCALHHCQWGLQTAWHYADRDVDFSLYHVWSTRCQSTRSVLLPSHLPRHVRHVLQCFVCSTALATQRLDRATCQVAEAASLPSFHSNSENEPRGSFEPLSPCLTAQTAAWTSPSRSQTFRNGLPRFLQLLGQSRASIFAASGGRRIRASGFRGHGLNRLVFEDPSKPAL